MDKVITITFNPAVDKSASVSILVPEKKLRCANMKEEPGGGGINVSRAMKRLGSTSTALYFAGGHTGELLRDLLIRENIDSVVVQTQDETRENVTIVTETSNQQYRFCFQGPRIFDVELQICLKYLRERTDYEYVVVSGSMPDSIPDDIVSRIGEIVKHKRARLIVDTSGEPLKRALEAGTNIFLIKPNLNELAYLVGKEELDAEQLENDAMKIIKQGGAQVVVVSLGASGAVLVTRGARHHVTPPPVTRRSTVGAGDSMVAGIIVALQRGYDWKDVLRMGVAAGTAATMNANTELCKMEDVEAHFKVLQKPLVFRSPDDHDSFSSSSTSHQQSDSEMKKKLQRITQQ